MTREYAHLATHCPLSHLLTMFFSLQPLWLCKAPLHGQEGSTLGDARLSANQFLWPKLGCNSGVAATRYRLSSWCPSNLSCASCRAKVCSCGKLRLKLAVCLFVCFYLTCGTGLFYYLPTGEGSDKTTANPNYYTPANSGLSVT